jgi:hypothetical protein
MEDKKNFFDYDIRILPSNISYGKKFYTMSHVHCQVKRTEKEILRKRKIKNILNAIDL